MYSVVAVNWKGANEALFNEETFKIKGKLSQNQLTGTSSTSLLCGAGVFRTSQHTSEFMKRKVFKETLCGYKE